jgi:hypothetical protein
LKKKKIKKNEKNKEKNECEGKVSKEKEDSNQKSKDKKNNQKSPTTQHLPYPQVPTKKGNMQGFWIFSKDCKLIFHFPKP